MADSFFGFNTTLPMDDDGGGELEPPEEDYDALNDETFGDAREGDWEDLHENLVRMSSKEFPSSSNSKKNTQNGSIRSEDDDDLDFSRFNFDDLDIGTEDNDIKVQLDPSVWAAPSLLHQQKANLAGNFTNFDPNTFLRQHFSQPQTLLQQQQLNEQQQMIAQHNRLMQVQQQRQQQQEGTIDILATLMKQAPKPQAPLKIVSVDELERNILMQQQQNKQVSAPKMPSAPQKVPGSPSKMAGIQPPPGMGSPRQHPMYSQVVQQQQQKQMMSQGGNNNTRGNNFPQMPPMMGSPRPPNMPPNMQRPPNMPMNMPPPHPMNNFGPPPFGQMRGFPPGGMPPGMRGPVPPPGHPLSQFYNQNPQNMQNSVKQFNMKLMEEIQQNHPMLQQLNRMHGGHHHNNMPAGNQQNGHPHHHQNTQNRQMMHHSQHPNGNNGNNKQHHGMNGNFRQEPQDPYANLMSNRDKQWLISIQLMQLNTETPYFDDFYFTVYKEKKAKGENRAYNNNQLNHPFNQGPKGHAHNMLMQAVANKNGMNNNNRNGMHNRERKNSESQKSEGNKEQGGRNYTPLQFENSLGKLQVGCGSVTAPRKIIDMEVVSAEPINTAAIIELNTQRKSSRTLLLHIETLYKVLLLLEDLENPVAIAAAQILKQKREKEHQQALEQAAIARAIAIANGEDVPELSENPTFALPSDKYPQPQTHDELIPKLLAGLTPEKVTAMMTVRKGKALLRRSMPLIKNQPHRWTVWCAIFASLNIILKKEKEVDPNVILLHEEFQRHLQFAKLENVVQVSRSFITQDKKMNFLFNNKSIGLSTIVSLILHAETLYSNTDYSRSESDEKQWEQFLSILTQHAADLKSANDAAAQKAGQQTMDSQVLKNIIQHLTRFATLQTKPLLNILTQVDSK